MADDRVPDDLRDRAKKMGLFGYAIPQEWGGLGLNLMQDVELAMELGYTSLALRSMFGTNNGIAGQVLVGFGTDEQKARWLEPIASGDVVASFALTEPGAGSNPAGLRTKAVRDGSKSDGAWVISGQKRFITNAPVANLFVVFARTRPADEQGPGIAVFLVPADAAGVEVGAKDAKMGQEGAWTADVSFTDVRVGAAALVGGSEDIGYRAAMTSLARGRVHIAALAVGAAQRALDESVAYAATATQGGTPIGSFQLVQAMLADQQTPRWPAAPWCETPRGSGSPAKTAGSRRRRRSSSAPKWPARSQIWRCRSTAAAATCVASRSSASIATFGCCGCTRAPARSSA